MIGNYKGEGNRRLPSGEFGQGGRPFFPGFLDIFGCRRDVEGGGYPCSEWGRGKH